MTALLIIALGFLPGLTWLFLDLEEDTHPEPKRLIAFTFVAGIAFGFFTIGIEGLATKGDVLIGIPEFSFAALIMLAFIEEFMKFAAAHFAMSKSPALREPVDAMVYMIVAALGFATLENIGAVANLPPGTLSITAIAETLSFRFVGATLLHTLTSGLVGYRWGLGIKENRPLRHLAVGLLIATLLHACFNYLILTFDNIGYADVFLLAIGFFVLNDFEALRGSRSAAPAK